MQIHLTTKQKNVNFKNVLNKTLEGDFSPTQTNERHISFGSEEAQPYTITTNRSTTYNHNGNNVDIDKEMTELAKNQIYYQALVDRMNGKFNSLQTVIRGGR